MAKLDVKTLNMVMDLAGIGPARVSRILIRPLRTVYAWRGEGSAHRNVPPGEIERLCLILDPSGERPDLIGWISLAARSRAESSKKPNRKETEV